VTDTIFQTNYVINVSNGSIPHQFIRHLDQVDNPSVLWVLDILSDYINVIKALEPNDSQTPKELCKAALCKITKQIKSAHGKGEGKLVVSQSPEAHIDWVQIDHYTWTYRPSFFDQISYSPWATTNRDINVARVAFKIAAAIKGKDLPDPYLAP
jgi:hypothetical protein